jgi:hypothetical protein
MSQPDWKRTERTIVSLLGGTRVPGTGRAGGDATDVAHPPLRFECKHRRSLPTWLTEAMAQAAVLAGVEKAEER